ncbi:MAG: hypothetical protein KBF75_04000 [Saprospiraceae bacterium]|nr:hypothetical protein [Saprospiraceae bacterium]MCO5277859.1 hypothetical protein [Saprospiraceae bacterium]HMT78128.1 hypothetical protein [Saprospiraceae bacterium]
MKTEFTLWTQNIHRIEKSSVTDIIIIPTSDCSIKHSAGQEWKGMLSVSICIVKDYTLNPNSY